MRTPREFHRLAHLRALVAGSVEALFSDNRLSASWLAVRAACLVGFGRIYTAVSALVVGVWYVLLGLWYVTATLAYVFTMVAVLDVILGLGIFPR